MKKNKPFFTIWTKPRATIATMIALNHYPYVFLISMAAGGISAWLKKPHQPISWVGGAFTGALTLVLLTELVLMTGRSMGGMGARPAVRASVAWGWIPYAVLMGPLGLLDQAAPSSFEHLSESESAPWAFVYLSMFLTHVWCLVITACCLAETQGFTLWRATVNLMFATVTGIALALSVFAGLMLLSGSF